MAVAALVTFAACQDGPAEPFSPDQLPVASTQQAPLQGAPGQEELVDAIPGFGGLYLEDGAVVINVTNIDEIGDADFAVMGYLNRLGAEAPNEIRIRQAEFPIPQLDQWFQVASPAVLGEAGAVFVDLDERANRITIGVEDAGMVEQARQIALDEGVPAEAIQVVLTDPILPMNSLQDEHDPIVGGQQINFPGFLCTLGFNAIADGDGGGNNGNGKGKNKSAPTAEPQAAENSFITNSHCTSTQGGVESTPYWQPLQSVNGEQIATEVEDPTYQKRIPGCPRGRRCRLSDASRARYDISSGFTLGAIARPSAAIPNTGSVAWGGLDAYNISGESTALMGQTVNKVGRTSGWTQGLVTGTDMNTGVSGTNIVLIGQTFVSAGGPQIVIGGDSGSAVWQNAGGSNVTLVGLLWGGNSSGTLFVYSPIDNIESEIGALQTQP